MFFAILLIANLVLGYADPQGLPDQSGQLSDIRQSQIVESCKAADAIESCRLQTERTLQALVGGSSVADQKKSISDCEIVCTATSPSVLEKYLVNCSEITKNNVKKEMDQERRRCGGTQTASADPGTQTASIRDPRTPQDHTVDGHHLRCFGEGTCPSERTISPTGVVEDRIRLTNGVIYSRKRTRRTEWYAYIGADGRSYQTYAEAFSANGPAVPPQGLGARQGLLFTPSDRLPLGIEGDGVTDPGNAEFFNASAEDMGLEDSVRPMARPEPPVIPGDEGSTVTPGRGSGVQNPGARNIAGQSQRSSQSVPFIPPQPLVEQASVSGAYLQKALQASPSSEVTTGGGGAASLGSSYTISEGSGGRGGVSGGVRFSGSGQQAMSAADFRNEVEAQRVDVRALPSPSLGAPTGSGGGAATPALPQGRMVAANARDRGAQEPGYRSEIFRSDTFYNGRGSLTSPARTRHVPVDPQCRPTRTKRCAMKRVALRGPNPSFNLESQCDGKPECILRLSQQWGWDRQGNRVRRVPMEAPESRSLSAHRGLASTAKGGIWRGYKNILVHMDTLGEDYLRLDHEGFLVVDDLKNP